MAISVVSFLFSRAAQPEAWGPSCWVLFSLPHLFSNSSDLQLTDFLSSLSYIIVQSPILYLWNGMFDRHQAEITVMQFTHHSFLVHQSMTVHWDFNPVPYCQPSLPTPMEYATFASLEWHVWWGQRSIYNINTNHHHHHYYLLNGIQCLRRANDGKFLLVGQLNKYWKQHLTK